MKVKVKLLSCVRLFVTPWTVAYQAPQSMEFSRQEYWSGLPFPSPGDLPNPGIKLGSPALQADALPSEPSGKPKTKSRNLPKTSHGLWVEFILCLGDIGLEQCSHLLTPWISTRLAQIAGVSMNTVHLPFGTSDKHLQLPDFSLVTPKSCRGPSQGSHGRPVCPGTIQTEACPWRCKNEVLSMKAAKLGMVGDPRATL